MIDQTTPEVDSIGRVSNERMEGRHSKFDARVYDFVLEDEHRKF